MTSRILLTGSICLALFATTALPMTADAAQVRRGASGGQSHVGGHAGRGGFRGGYRGGRGGGRGFGGGYSGGYGYGGGYYGGVCGPIQVVLGFCGPYGY